MAFMKMYFRENIGKWCFWEFCLKWWPLKDHCQIIYFKSPKSKIFAFRMKLAWPGPSVSFQSEPRALDSHFCFPYLPWYPLLETRPPECLPHLCSTIPATLNLSQMRLSTMTFYLPTLLLWMSSFPQNSSLLPLHLANSPLLPGFTSGYVSMWKIKIEK